jgi:hypothetical protein
MHDSKFWRECHILVPIVGFSHSEETLATREVFICTKWSYEQKVMELFL